MNVADNVTEADLDAHWGVKACRVCEVVRPRSDFFKSSPGSKHWGLMDLRARCKICTMMNRKS